MFYHYVIYWREEDKFHMVFSTKCPITSMHLVHEIRNQRESRNDTWEFYLHILSISFSVWPSNHHPIHHWALDAENRIFLAPWSVSPMEYIWLVLVLLADCHFLRYLELSNLLILLQTVKFELWDSSRNPVMKSTCENISIKLKINMI